MAQQLMEQALLALDSGYPYPMDEENLRIEYETLFDMEIGASKAVSVETMARRMINVLRGI